jgi:hypothetical protein
MNVPPPTALHQPPQPSQNFQINANTFIDDEEYGLNV